MNATAKAIAADPATPERMLYLALMAISVYLLMIAPAFAITTTAMGNVLCQVANLISSDLGRGLATLGILAVGVGATLGRVTWTMAVTVAVGISVITGANQIASDMGVTSCTTFTLNSGGA